jgi:hypothetical protein
MTDSPRPPFDDVRAAFERLATPDKLAFVLEAAFDTVGQAIGDAGRQVSEAIAGLDVDGLFRSAAEPTGPTGPSGDPTPPASGRPKRGGAGRTAPGTPPTDDGPPAI